MSKKSLFGILLLFALSVNVTGQDFFPMPEQSQRPYSIKSWTTSNGLPQNSINDIIQDPLGFIWVFTNEGAARFDGSKFEIFNSQNTPELAANRLEDAEITEDGIIWCTSSEGYLVRIDSRTKKFSSKKSPKRLFFTTRCRIK